MKRTFNRAPLSVRTPSNNDIGEYSLNLTNWKGLSDNENFIMTDQESFADCDNVYVDDRGLLRSRPALKPSYIELDNTVLENVIEIWSVGKYILYLTSDLILYITLRGSVSHTINVTSNDIKVGLYKNLMLMFIESEIRLYDIYKNEEVALQDVVYAPLESEGYNEDKNLIADFAKFFVVYANDYTLSDYFYDIQLTYTDDEFDFSYSMTYGNVEDVINIIKPLYTAINVNTSKMLVGGTNVVILTNDGDLYLIRDGQLHLLPNLPTDGTFDFDVNISENGDALFCAYVTNFYDVDFETEVSYYPNKAFDINLARMRLTNDSFSWVVQELSNRGLSYYARNAWCNHLSDPRVYVSGLNYNNLIVTSQGLVSYFKDGVEHHYNHRRTTRNVTLGTFVESQMWATGRGYVFEDALENTRFVYVALEGSYLDLSVELHDVDLYQSAENLLKAPVCHLMSIPPSRSNYGGQTATLQNLSHSNVTYDKNKIYVYCDAYYKTDSDVYASGIRVVDDSSVNLITPSDSVKVERLTAPVSNSPGEFLFFNDSSYFLSRDILYRKDDASFNEFNLQIKLYNIHSNKHHYYGYYDHNGQTYIVTNNIDNPIELYGVRYGELDVSKPDVIYYDNETIYYGSKNKLLITEQRYDDDGNILIYFPARNVNVFESDISTICKLSETEMGVFLKDSLYVLTKSSMSESIGNVDLKFTVYHYNKSKIQTGCEKYSDVMTSFDGKYIYFVSSRGLVYLSMQEFVNTTEQTLNYLSDVISVKFKSWSLGAIKMVKFDNYILLYKTDDLTAFILDVRNNSWYKWSWPKQIKKALELNGDLYFMTDDKLLVFDYSDDKYYDVIDKQYKIPWYVLSKKLHLNGPNDYKTVNSMIFNSVLNSESKDTLLEIFQLQTISYDDLPVANDNEVVEFGVKYFQSLVKPIRRIKIKAFQYRLSSYLDEFEQAPLSLSHITIKYKISGRIR